MNLNELRPAEGSKRERRRIGRGHGTGWGKTAGKGHNGQKQRSGSYVSPIFEGGQMPIVRRIPKRGFSNHPFKKGVVKNPRFITKYSDETLRNINGRKAVKAYLKENIDSYVKEREYTSLLKVIGNTEVDKKLTVKAHRISKTAKELIEKAGGSVELLEIRSYSAKAGNNKKEEEVK